MNTKDSNKLVINSHTARNSEEPETNNIETNVNENNNVSIDFENIEDSTSEEHRLLHIKICSLNVHGLAKFEGDIEFQQYCKSYDIVGLCETWADKNEDFSDLLDGYQIMNTLRQKRGNALRNSGGICVLIKQYLTQKNIVKRVFDDLV